MIYIRSNTADLCNLILLKPVGRILALSLFLIATGCANTSNVQKSATLRSDDGSVDILIMPLDVELSLLTATGLQELNAEWTENATRFMKTAIDEKLADSNFHALSYDTPTQDPKSDLVQLEKLHEAVGGAVMLHHFLGVNLPSKKGGFDWSLGEKAQLLGEQNDADYALFIYFRDSYSSAGRVALQVVALLAGAAVPGGEQQGFASLVDLNSGDLIWFNYLRSATGDARKPETAKKTVTNLLDNFPS